MYVPFEQLGYMTLKLLIVLLLFGIIIFLVFDWFKINDLKAEMSAATER